MYKKLLAHIISVVTILCLAFSFSSCSRNNPEVIVESESVDVIELEEVTEATTKATESSETEVDVIETEDTSESEEVVETTAEETIETTEATEETEKLLDPDGIYTSKDDVALYIYQYGELPSNFMTKAEARELGWQGGSLEDYAPNMCIGGDYFGNYEGLLPEEKGREYHECDIDTLGAKSRGAKRIIFSNDGLIYYTDDHYESFTLLYGEE